MWAGLTIPALRDLLLRFWGKRKEGADRTVLGKGGGESPLSLFDGLKNRAGLGGGLPSSERQLWGKVYVLGGGVLNATAEAVQKGERCLSAGLLFGNRSTE